MGTKWNGYVYQFHFCINQYFVSSCKQSFSSSTVMMTLQKEMLTVNKLYGTALTQLQFDRDID
jgi:hypothetical protein